MLSGTHKVRIYYRKTIPTKCVDKKVLKPKFYFYYLEIER